MRFKTEGLVVIKQRDEILGKKEQWNHLVEIPLRAVLPEPLQAKSNAEPLLCATIQPGLLSCMLNCPCEYNNERRESTCRCTFPPFQSPTEENTDFQKVTLIWDEHIIHS